MRKYKVLCLTHHGGHSKENSMYAILSSMANHHQCEEVVVASRSNEQNNGFFYENDFSELDGVKVDSEFNFEDSQKALFESNKKIDPSDYDIIFLRLPRPTTDEFLLNLETNFSDKCIVNKPSGIITCSSKSVLLNFKDVCPPIQLCHSIKEVLDFSKNHNMVLKPLKEYGGRGLIRIKDGVLNDGLDDYPISDYLDSIKDTLKTDGYLAMKYLENVDQGDKRLIVVNGEILASSLRLPADGNWLCNVAMGGTSIKSEPEQKEIEIINKINPFLLKHGILIYGADTLVDDNGDRILSEINALSIGGFPQAQVQTGKPIIKLTLDKFFNYADVHYTR